jgi:hypothetical protein
MAMMAGVEREKPDCRWALGVSVCVPLPFAVVTSLARG